MIDHWISPIVFYYYRYKRLYGSIGLKLLALNNYLVNPQLVFGRKN